MRIDGLVFVTSGYPSNARISLCSFVREEVRGLASKGIRCIVINPIAWWHGLKSNGYPFKEIEHVRTADGDFEFTVLRPRFFSIPPQLECVRFFRELKFRLFCKSAEKIILREKIKFNAVVGQFLSYGGCAAVRIGEKFNAFKFVEIGEGRLGYCRKAFPDEKISLMIRPMTHFICNGSHLKSIMISKYGVPEQKVSVVQNGIDVELFKPLDKAIARKKLSIPEDRFVVCSIGNYLHDKGVCRVASAIDGLEGVAGVYAGSGPCPPVGDNVLISRRFKHEELPWLLAAADVFVLPTLVEGCCNAIQEAMACGKPIIGPNTCQVSDLIDASCAILVDPLNVAEIRSAVLRLKADKLLMDRLAANALARGRGYDMKKKTDRLISILEQSMNGISKEKMER